MALSYACTLALTPISLPRRRAGRAQRSRLPLVRADYSPGSRWQAQGRTHSGILLIYQDNVRGKDMGLPDVVRAISNLVASGLPIANELHSLNQWR